MVREVMFSALVASAVALVALPARALADEGEDVAQPVVVPSTTYDYSQKLDTISQDVRGVGSSVDLERTDVVNHLITIETLLSPTPEPEPVQEVKEEKSDELKTLESIDKGIEALSETLATEVVEVEQQAPLKAASRATFAAYANASPTNQYAYYAAGYLPRMGFGEHYAYLQDTSSSYVLVWGNLTESDGGITGSGQWVRWYYASNSVGYVTETGSGSVTVSPSGHVVLSDLDGYPMLVVGDELLRREVGFYAVVACAVFCLSSVLGFCVRLRGAVSV